MKSPLDRGNLIVVIVTLCMVVIMCGAVVSQEFSWWVIPFLALFVTIFASILSVCYSIFQSDRFAGRARKDFPDQPWMWNRQWQSDVIASQSRHAFWSGFALTIILSVFASTGFFATAEGLPEGNFWTLLGFVPLPFAVYCARETWLAWQVLRLAKCTKLVLQTRPAWTGDKFSAQLYLTDIQPFDTLEACLVFTKTVKRIEREVGDGERVVYTKVEDRKINGKVELGPSEAGSCVAYVSADIPHNSPATSWNDSDEQGACDLAIAISFDNKTLTLRYEIPIAERR
jgi:hypothetical protein